MQVTLDEAQKRLSDLFNAAVGGDEVIIFSEAGQAVKLVAVEVSTRSRQAGSAKGKVWMSDDFDAPLEDFKEYTE